MNILPCVKFSYKTCLILLTTNTTQSRHLCFQRQLYGLRNSLSYLNAKMKNSETHLEASFSIKNSSSEDGEKKLGKHIQITSQSFRNEVISEAVVTEIFPFSTTVKGFTLKVLNPEFTFIAGQWVDAFIPNLETVGGFSICSSPLKLREEGSLSLGIKNSFWPPAKWFYNECKPGCKISIRVGGNFYYPDEINDTSDLLLIAGGVGVNPIFSIYSYLFHRGRDQRIIKTGLANKVYLLYSAKSKDELIYKAKIDDVVRCYSEDTRVQYFITKEQSSDNGMTRKRISLEHIQNTLKCLNKSRTKVYICGPPSMIEALNDYVLQCGVPSSRIHFEKWW